MLTRTDRAANDETHLGEERSKLDLEMLKDLVQRLWTYALLGSLLCLLLGFFYLVAATPMYTADASLLLDTQSNQFLKKQNIMADPIVDTGVVDSQVEVLNSESIALAVIHKLKLTDDPEFVGPPKGLFGKLMVDGLTFASWIKGELGFSDKDGADDPPERKALTVFAKHLSVKRVGITYVIDLSYSSEDPVKSAKIANAVAQAYIDEELEASYASTARASQWLQGRLQDIRSLATNADRAVQTYKSQHGIVDTGKGLMNQEQISDLNSQLIVAKAATAEAKARLDRIHHVNGDDVLDATVTDALSNAVITRLRAQYLDLQARQADLSARLGAKHETAIKLRDQMKEIKIAISNEVQQIADAYASDYAIAQARETSLQTSLATMVGNAGTSDLAQVKLRDLQSSAESYRQLYDDFLQKAQEATQQQTSPMTATRVITAANVPLHKSSPKSLLVLAASLLVGAAMGGGVGYVREMTSGTLLTPEDVVDATRSPCLGTLPDLGRIKPLRARGEPNTLMQGDNKLGTQSICEYVLDVPFSRYSETLRNVKIAIDNSGALQTKRVIAVTSSVPKEGKTTVAMNLASLTASYGLKTLIIDGDLHNRGLSKLCAPQAKEGLLQALADPSRLTTLGVVRPRSGLTILPCVVTGRLTNAAEILGSAQMHELLTAARADYDYVFLDLPPIGPVVDGKAAAVLVDDVVFVVKWGKSSRRMVNEALWSADSIRERTIGVVLNNADPIALRRIERYRTKEFDAYYAG